MIDEDGLDFFNSLSGRLRIKLTEPAQPASPQLLNLVAPKDARIVSVELVLSVFDNDDARPLTEEEWSRVVLRAPAIKMASLDTTDVVVETPSPNGEVFTVRDLKDAIARTEQMSRDRGEWMGGVDVHHVYFEGIECEDDVWMIAWGS